jgi:hypothetical protein
MASRACDASRALLIGMAGKWRFPEMMMLKLEQF